MDRWPLNYSRPKSRMAPVTITFGLLLAGGALQGVAQPVWQAAGPAETIVVRSGPQAAVERPGFAGLWQVLRLSDVIAIMAREGQAYGDSLGKDMFPSRVGPAWTAEVARIHDSARMEDVFRQDLAAALGEADIAPMLAFFDTSAGRHITGLEISAREAMLDEAVEEASRDMAETLQARNPTLFGAISEFVEVNDLVEMNVAGAMNANMAFYMGLMDGNPDRDDMSEGEILAEIWAQEPDIRVETETWVYSYLALAYRPLPEGMLAEYTRFSRSDAGRVLNAALFAAFDTLFVDISRDLGRAVAARMVGEEL